MTICGEIVYLWYNIFVRCDITVVCEGDSSEK